MVFRRVGRATGLSLLPLSSRFLLPSPLRSRINGTGPLFYGSAASTCSGAGAVFYRTDHRHHSLLGRHPGDRLVIYRGTHAHQGHRAGERRCSVFWKVVDPMKAALDVADYRGAINWAARTALRDVIGKTVLSDMLEGRGKISTELQKIIDERTEPWASTLFRWRSRTC